MPCFTTHLREVSTYGQVALCSLPSCQPFSDLVRDLMFAASWDGGIPNGFFLEFD